MAQPVQAQARQVHHPEPEEQTCYCWPFCPKPKVVRAHERALTQHELDYSRILRIEAAQKRALEAKA